MSLARVAGRRVVLSVSGGKDSAAASLHLRELGIAHERVFADTGWENPLTYEYLRGPLTDALGPIREVRAKKLFADLVREKGIFPDRTKRFCTVILKVEPISAYLESLDEDVVNVVGIRRDESAARKNVAEWEYSKKLDCDVWRPLAAWSLEDVKAIHARHGLRPNPLYAMGASRVGCWPCIHARKSELRLVSDPDPSRIVEISALEREVTEDARARALAKGQTLDWERSLFSVRLPMRWVCECGWRAAAGRDRTPEVEEHAAVCVEGQDGLELRRPHAPMPIEAAVSWARSESPAERGTREKRQQAELFADPQDSCGEWGFCDTSPEAA